MARNPNIKRPYTPEQILQHKRARALWLLRGAHGGKTPHAKLNPFKNKNAAQRERLRTTFALTGARWHSLTARFPSIF